VPPLPPHVDFEQAKHLAQAVAAGDPRSTRIARQSFAQLVRAHLPRRSPRRRDR
jgi:pyruvate dehydrogenase (quinone)